MGNEEEEKTETKSEEEKKLLSLLLPSDAVCGDIVVSESAFLDSGLASIPSNARIFSSNHQASVVKAFVDKDYG